LAKPGSIKPHAKFEAEVYILSKDEGGRHTIKVLSVSRLGVGIYESSASTNLKIEGTPISDVSPSKALSALPKITGHKLVSTFFCLSR
jgi:translation elongation factor EF-Tu-like GTPase